ncbi:helix-turn-helix domain-containing protein [Streptomyces sp. WMMB 322]|uniref:helix-turn-helix domain-containing protein n=1 Tax=Streptomyces sp. WMMB 322 TaxID=1286821 RepID=UPI0006E17FB6|nr:helix-turn-helix domain-containing protein [Streptomyces sp. WMMB 322]SCK05926.1 Winged helix-turn-helix DNA-binding [Streptomyces sp. WMMB 322]
MLTAPAKQLHPDYGHLPGWAVPARIRTRVHQHLDEHGESRTGEIADELDLPRSTVSSALRYLTADGMAVKSRWGVWTSTPRTQHRGPQVPLSGGEAR